VVLGPNDDLGPTVGHEHDDRAVVWRVGSGRQPEYGSRAVPWSTLEVRWFLPCAPEGSGSPLESWFRTRPRHGGGEPPPLAWEPAPPSWRQDRYLMIPGHDDMGIKWRERRLEIKGREASLGRRAFAPGIEGLCERWIKWSFGGDPIAHRLLELFRGAEGVVLVEKRRLQRCIRVEPAGGVVEVGRDALRQRGVNAELTRIRLPGARIGSHWSLAFEAFPADQQMAEPFAQVVAGFLEGCPALPLSAGRSMSYPRWLLEVAPPAGAPG
jgi:hypothetical protein